MIARKVTYLMMSADNIDLILHNVAFIIACLVSFRALFVQTDQRIGVNDKGRQHLPADNNIRRKKSLAKRILKLRDTFLDTCRTWEGDLEPSEGYFIRPFTEPTQLSTTSSIDLSRNDMESAPHEASKSSAGNHTLMVSG